VSTIAWRRASHFGLREAAFGEGALLSAVRGMDEPYCGPNRPGARM
jgi:hypothetical protein